MVFGGDIPESCVVPPPLASEETIVANERLRLLSWGYYFSGGMGALFASFLMIYAVMFGAMSFIPEGDWGGRDQSEAKEKLSNGESLSEEKVSPRRMGPPVILFRVMAGVMIGATMVGWLLAGLTFYAGWCIRGRKHRGFVFVIAAYNVMWIPYGTILGVFTFIVLNSREASRQFQIQA